jgi:virginiamycin B lyase
MGMAAPLLARFEPEEDAMTKTEFPWIAAAMTVSGVVAAACAVAPALAQSLPNGNGKEVVEMVCAGCHDLSPITEAGFSRDDWNIVVQSMIMMGAVIKPEQVAQVTDYLAANFPPKPKR